MLNNLDYIQVWSEALLELPATAYHNTRIDTVCMHQSDLHSHRSRPCEQSCERRSDLRSTTQNGPRLTSNHDAVEQRVPYCAGIKADELMS